jgi:collagen triple helix repeat protein
MPRFRIITTALVLALVVATPAADAGTSLAKQVAHALRVTNHADKTAKAALTASKRGAKGDAGMQGPSGPAGLNGSNGSNGSHWTAGNDGRDGSSRTRRHGKRRGHERAEPC